MRPSLGAALFAALACAHTGMGYSAPRDAIGRAPLRRLCAARASGARARVAAADGADDDESIDVPLTPASAAAALTERALVPARQLLVIASAVSLSGKLSDFSSDAQSARLAGALRAAVAEAEPALGELVAAFAERAPAALLAIPPASFSNTEGDGAARGGDGACRLAGGVPCEVAALAGLDPLCLLALARLAAWAPASKWVRPLADWAPAQPHAPEPVLRSLQAHLLERYPTAAALHGALTHADHQAAAEAGRKPSSSASGATGALLRLVGAASASSYAARASASALSLPCSEGSHRVSHAFFEVLARSGAGEASVRDALSEALGGYAVTKREAKELAALVPAPPEPAGAAAPAPAAAAPGGPCVALQMAMAAAAAVAPPGSEPAPPAGSSAPSAAALARLSPLHAWRESQCRALGCPDWLVRAACSARMGRELTGSAPLEQFAQSTLQWAATHADALDAGGELQARALLDFAREQRAQRPDFEMAGRTVKRVLEALESWSLGTIDFEGETDEQFEPNPTGLAPMFVEGATIPPGTRLRVPYDSSQRGGAYRLGDPGERGSEPVSVSVTEIRSLRRLLYEGKMLNNCLENKFDSQIKYISRARQRVSSFWSLTYARPAERSVEHKCLVEVWHLREGDVVRQAEGPRPRTIPSADAFYWVAQWCEANGVDLSTWDCYSRVEMPIEPDDFARTGRI